MRALVVDDSRTMRRIIGNILSTMGYQEVLQAENGQEALDVLEALETPPELACVDWNMPIMDGLTFVTQVRKRREWHQTTLMMVTTESEHDRIVRALAAGAHEYLTKPFEADDMRQKLEFLGLVPDLRVEV